VPPVGFERQNLSKQAAADLSLRPRGHWDRQKLILLQKKKFEIFSRPVPYATSVLIQFYPWISVMRLIHTGKVLGQTLASPVYLSSLKSAPLPNVMKYHMF